MRFEHRRLPTNGIELHVVDAGPEDGEPIVFLHGFPEFWRAWQRQIPHFAAAGYRVLAPDQRGYNLSDKPRGVAAYSLDELVADTVGLLDTLAIERAFLVGHDWGGAVAWWAALRFPERFRRLVVLNIPHPVVFRRFLRENRRQRRNSWYIFLFQLPWIPEYWYRRNDFAIGTRSLKGSSRRGTFTDDDLAAYRETWRQPGAMTATINWYRAVLRKRPKPITDSRVHIPTLLLWGERDRFLDVGMAQPSIDLCDDGRLVRLPEATHWLQHEEPDRVNEKIAGFFT